MSINLKSFGRDINGNSIVKFTILNKHENSLVTLSGKRINTDKPVYSYSLQTNGNLPITHNIKIRGQKIIELSKEDIENIENEVINFLVKHGSNKQKFLLS